MTNKKQKIIFLSSESDCFMADEWYKFATSDHFWMKWRFEALRRIIPKNCDWGQTLEIGCGTGVVREQIENYYGCTVAGCDLNLTALQMAIESNSPLYFYNIHQKNEAFKENFSTILLLDVLEHIEDPVTFLYSVSYHLKKGGRVIINVPAFQFLYSQYDKKAGHIRRYTISVLENELNIAGFRIERASYWGMSLIPVLIVRRLILPFYSKDKIIKVGFKPVSPLVDHIFRFIMKLEYAISHKPPAGTSLIAVARKE
jgi:SAM-dependent methyltransferase